MRAFSLLALLLTLLSGFAGEAEAQPSGCPFSASACKVLPTGGTHSSTLAAIAARTFWAQDYGNCTWGGSNDVSSCINGAIAAAAAAGGGTVKIPAGTFNVGTTIAQSTTAVHIEGAGVGNPRDSNDPSKFISGTRLVWTGAAGGTLFDLEPTGGQTLFSADVVGVVFDCASLANVCAKISSVTDSQIDIGVAEPRITGAWITTVPALADSPGTQNNDFSIRSRSTDASYSPTGILIDGNSGFNVSENRFRDLFAWYYKGDGIVFGSQDNNQVFQLRTYGNPGATGSSVVVAAPGYVMPSGGSVTAAGNYVAADLMVYHTEATVTVQGYTVGARLTAGGGNAGAAAVTPVTLTTNGTTAQFGRFLNYAATTGVAAGMDFSCAGGPSSGIVNHSTVAFTATTTVSPSYYPVGAVASGQACTFTWGVTIDAVPGTYTLTATGATTWNITAPAGGHSQTGISVSGGVLAFTDVVIPMSGNAVANDTFTLVVPARLSGVQILGTDSTNSVPTAYFAPGAGGATSTLVNPIPQINDATASGGILMSFARSECANIVPSASGGKSVVIGDCGGGGASGAFSFVGNGSTNVVSGFGSGTVAGQNLTLTGIDEFVGGGASITLNGNYSRAMGQFAVDRGRTGVDVQASGQIAAAGDAQIASQVLRGTGSSASAFQLTADGAAAGNNNCGNIPNNTAYQLVLNIVALDHTTVTKSEAWSLWAGLLTRGANAASTAVTMAATPTPITNGTVTGSAISVTADTTNGCLNVSFTPPAANTDKWNAVATVRTVEVQ